MIVSHKHKFIFVKPVKTGGTSLLKMLANHCGQNDIFADCYNSDGHIVVRGKMPDGTNIDSHMPAHEIKRRFPMEWDSYRKITMVRNPWDMVAAVYFYSRRKWWGKDARFPTYFNEFADWHIYGSMSSHERWLLNSEPYADFTVRFEHLAEDCEALFRELGLPWEGMLHLNQNKEKPNTHYAYLYSARTRDTIGAKFDRVIKDFGYKFEHPFDYEGQPHRYDHQAWLRSTGRIA